MTRQKIVAGNWKMNGSKESITDLVNSLLEADQANSEVVVAPSFPYLHLVSELCAGCSIKFAAQDVSDKEKGAFTGEVSALMLKDFNVKYVLVGHSERRSIYGETNDLIAKKVQALLAQNFIPMLCVGETLEQREAGQTLLVCEKQIKAVLELVGIEAFNNIVIAYEPVWAIGTGLSATSEQAQDVHCGIRAFIAKSSELISQRVQILYGGSVKASTSSALFAMPDIDGALVGGASLDAEEFLEIVKAAG